MTEQKSAQVSARIDEFKARIGYADLEKMEETPAAVKLDWSALPRVPLLAGAGWKIKNERISSGKAGTALRRWVLEQGGEQVLLQVFVSSIGAAPARNNLLLRAALTDPGKIPYSKSPVGVGDLAVVAPFGDAARDIIWVFKNVCIQLVALNNDTQLLMKLAQEYDRLIKKNVTGTLAPYFPPLKGVQVLPPQPVVGDSIKIVVNFSGAAKPEDYLVEFEAPSEALDYLGQNQNTAQYQALQSGEANVLVKVADRSTLLSSFKQVGFKIVPAEKQ